MGFAGHVVYRRSALRPISLVSQVLKDALVVPRETRRRSHVLFPEYPRAGRRLMQDDELLN